ncbi:hypothetical protein KLEB271_gp88 [Bacillus phage vB_BauS_KLEB27-1]|nr:hypothetical protein KLEB271_gp88 [Bacillus phage vB_BauS_KLEB27-1]
MTEEKRTIHVLKDEKLGVDREYVAVDRDAEVGETIIITECQYDGGEFYGVGHYGEVVTSSGEYDDYVDFNGFNNSFVYRGGRWNVGSNNDSAYHVLEPTDIVHIDGERYRLEDRKAEVGERVIYVNKENGKSDGGITEVNDIDTLGVRVNEYEDSDGVFVHAIRHGSYRVLTPVQDAAEAQESDVITVLVNLGAEVAELKRKNEQFEQALGWNEMGPGYIPEIRNGLCELKSVVSNYESEIGRMQAEINALHEDKVRLGEQLAKVTADDPRALSFTADEFAQIIVSLSRAGL